MKLLWYFYSSTCVLTKLTSSRLKDNFYTSVYCQAVSLLGFRGLVYMLELPELQCGTAPNLSLNLDHFLDSSRLMKSLSFFFFLVSVQDET